MKYPEINKNTKQHWTDKDFADLKTAETISDVFRVALNVISRMPNKVGQVCGPVTSGGKGSVEENLLFLNNTIADLQEKGLDIFDQMPYEETFHRIVNSEKYNQKYGNILSDFYEPLFMLGKIDTFYFVPGWESSNGANWEYKKAKELGFGIKIL